jgi:hypothetical protein
MTWIDIVMMTISIGISTALIVIIIVFAFLYNKNVVKPLGELRKSQELKNK